MLLLKDESARNLSREEAVSIVAKVVGTLVKPVFCTLALIMRHLNRVAANESLNQMSATNLGIVFGPTLLQS